MVAGEICCVQIFCTILSELHSICCNVPYGQTQRYSVICLIFRQATISSFGIRIRFSHFMQRLVSCLPKHTPKFINHEICHKIVNLNSLEINHDHFPGMSSPNFRLPGGSLGYWTACNNFKRYCTLPYCVNAIFSFCVWLLGARLW